MPGGTVQFGLIRALLSVAVVGALGGGLPADAQMSIDPSAKPAATDSPIAAMVPAGMSTRPAELALPQSQPDLEPVQSGCPSHAPRACTNGRCCPSQGKYNCPYNKRTQLYFRCLPDTIEAAKDFQVNCVSARDPAANRVFAPALCN